MMNYIEPTILEEDSFKGILLAKYYNCIGLMLLSIIGTVTVHFNPIFTSTIKPIFDILLPLLSLIALVCTMSLRSSIQHIEKGDYEVASIQVKGLKEETMHQLSHKKLDCLMLGKCKNSRIYTVTKRKIQGAYNGYLLCIPKKHTYTYFIYYRA